MNNWCGGQDAYGLWGDADFVPTFTDLIVFRNTFAGVATTTPPGEAGIRITDGENLIIVDNKIGTELKHTLRLHGSTNDTYVKWYWGEGRGFMIGTFDGDNITNLYMEDSEVHMSDWDRICDDCSCDWRQGNVTNLTVDNVDVYTDNYCCLPSEIAGADPTWSISNSTCFADDAPP